MYSPIYIKEYYIYDIFHNDNNELIIISPIENKQLEIKYKDEKFNVKICPHNHTYVYILNKKIRFKSIILLNIDGKDITTKVNKYPEFNDEIIMTTMVKNEDNIILQWIKFHHNIGIDRFIIYDNKGSDCCTKCKKNTDAERKVLNNSNLKKLLNNYIEKGIVILIEWKYNKFMRKSGISGQSTQQNHSIWAFKNCKYIGLFDIDEYLNLQHHKNIKSFFKDLIKKEEIKLKEIGSFRILNKFFYNPNNLPTDGFNFLKVYNCDKVTISKKSGREKNFIIPKNVDIYCIHKILLGKKMINISESDLFFNHYCYLNKVNRGKKITNLIDNSINKHIKKFI